MTEFPSNSKHPPRQPEPEQKKVEQVTTGEVVARKKTLGKRLKEIFIGGDSKSVLQYVIGEVLVPQAKDMITEAASSGLERLIYGDSRPHRRMGSRPGGPSGQTNYTRYAVRGNNPIGRSERPDRTPNAQVRQHAIDDILLATRPEAETVLDRLYDLLREYQSASVADLYQLIGWSSSYTDNKWGWEDLHGSTVQRVRDGYILNLPKPVSLD
jgi:hypothetical protein